MLKESFSFGAVPWTLIHYSVYAYKFDYMSYVFVRCSMEGAAAGKKAARGGHKSCIQFEFMENNCAASVFCFASSESQNFFPLLCHF